MNDNPTLRLVAQAAHECWCARMREQGWQAAPHYSQETRAHDALVPFESLALADQRRTLRALRCEDIASFLADLLDYPRGEPGLPELQIEDMAIGRAVQRVAHCDQAASGPANRGRISSWTINPQTGDLDVVRIRWDDGSESEHTPPERELTLGDSARPPRPPGPPGPRPSSPRLSTPPGA
jgi:hypothetical protein